MTSKVMALLGAFEEPTGTLSLSELAAQADLPLPTAHRLVGELVEHGALRRDAFGRYRVGRRVWRIGQNAGRELRHSARHHLTDLFVRTGATCLLAIRDDTQALVIERIDDGSRSAAGPMPGFRLSLSTAAMGLVLLAHEAPWLREAYLARPEVAEPTRLADDLAAIRRRRHAMIIESGLPGCSLAVPVLGTDGRALAAVALVVPSTSPDQVRRHLGPLTETAHRLEPEARLWPTTREVLEAFEPYPLDDDQPANDDVSTSAPTSEAGNFH